MTRIIFLSNGKECLVDDEDYQWASQSQWRENNYGYVVRNKRIDGVYIHFLLHREIIEAPKGIEVDHINLNKLDNRRSNLRLASRQENSRNRKALINNKCNFKGVCQQGKKFLAYIYKDGKQIRLGYFDDATSAAHARDKAEKEMFGEFANLNFAEVGA